MPGASKFLDFMRDPRSSAEILAGPSLELKHSALPKRKFERHRDFWSIVVCISVIITFSTRLPFCDIACNIIWYYNRYAVRMGYRSQSRLMANFDKNFLFILVIVAFSIILL